MPGALSAAPGSLVRSISAPFSPLTEYKVNPENVDVASLSAQFRPLIRFPVNGKWNEGSGNLYEVMQNQVKNVSRLDHRSSSSFLIFRIHFSISKLCSRSMNIIEFKLKWKRLVRNFLNLKNHYEIHGHFMNKSCASIFKFQTCNSTSLWFVCTNFSLPLTILILHKRYFQELPELS